MYDFGTLDLDEHAAFWARDDERAGVADERFEFAIGDEKFVARCRRARFVRDEKTDRDRESYFYEIGESGALLVAIIGCFLLCAERPSRSICKIITVFGLSPARSGALRRQNLSGRHRPMVLSHAR